MRRSILLLCTGLGRGGAETQLLLLARRLSDEGRRVTIVTLLDHNEWPDEIVAWGLDVRTLGVERGRVPLRASLRLARWMRQLQPDVVVSFLVAANTVASLARVVFRAPRLVTSIRSVVPDGGWQPAAMRWTRRASDVVVFNSGRVRDDAVARGVFDRDRCTVIRNALDRRRFDDARGRRLATRQALGVGDAFVWLAVGNVRPVKNYPALVEAFARLHRGHPEARLVIAGQPYGDVEAMQRVAPELWATGVVRYLGQRTDVPDLMAAADAYVLSSRHEGSPNTVIEAMASRLPVVATDVGGAGELLAGERGWLAARSDADALHDALLAVHEASDAERDQRAAAGRHYVETEHDPEAVHAAWLRAIDPA